MDKLTNWQNIHINIMKFRSAHDVTIREFLEMCELPKDSYIYQVWCSSDGCNLHPVKGLHDNFLNPVQNFLQQQDISSIKIHHNEHSLRDIVRDLHLEDSTLRKLGVSGFIRCIGEDHLVVSILKGFDREAIFLFLRESIPRDFRISSRSVTLL